MRDREEGGGGSPVDIEREDDGGCRGNDGGRLRYGEGNKE